MGKGFGVLLGIKGGSACQPQAHQVVGVQAQGLVDQLLRFAGEHTLSVSSGHVGVIGQHGGIVLEVQGRPVVSAFCLLHAPQCLVGAHQHSQAF